MPQVFYEVLLKDIRYAYGVGDDKDKQNLNTLMDWLESRLVIDLDQKVLDYIQSVIKKGGF